MIRKNWLGLLLGTSLLAASVLPNAAQAFCGFYVSGADASLYNNATMVVLLRDGTRTVLSMQNSYQGPPEDFALVIPVPVVLQKENVKTLDDALFAKIDRLAAPRLVEYWEEDPCAPDYLDMMVQEEGGAGGFDDRVDRQVRIEAQFQVGEYDVVVLGADESTALDTWLRQNNYKIPEGAEPFLRPYVQSGQYFFVAKVNAKRVKFKDGQARESQHQFTSRLDQSS